MDFDDISLIGIYYQVLCYSITFVRIHSLRGRTVRPGITHRRLKHTRRIVYFHFIFTTKNRNVNQHKMVALEFNWCRIRVFQPSTKRMINSESIETIIATILLSIMIGQSIPQTANNAIRRKVLLATVCNVYQYAEHIYYAPFANVVYNSQQHYISLRSNKFVRVLY